MALGCSMLLWCLGTISTRFSSVRPWAFYYIRSNVEFKGQTEKKEIRIGKLMSRSNKSAHEQMNRLRMILTKNPHSKIIKRKFKLEVEMQQLEVKKVDSSN